MQKKRAWLYCRINQHNKPILDIQKSILERYATDNGFSVVGVTAEYCSGISLERPGISEVLNAASEGQMDVLIAKDVSRLSRETEGILRFVHSLKDYGCELRCVDGVDFSLIKASEKLFSSLAALPR